jgi:hypothetical protein
MSSNKAASTCKKWGKGSSTLMAMTHQFRIYLLGFNRRHAWEKGWVGLWLQFPLPPPRVNGPYLFSFWSRLSPPPTAEGSEGRDTKGTGALWSPSILVFKKIVGPLHPPPHSPLCWRVTHNYYSLPENLISCVWLQTPLPTFGLQMAVLLASCLYSLIT